MLYDYTILNNFFNYIMYRYIHLRHYLCSFLFYLVDGVNVRLPVVKLRGKLMICVPFFSIWLSCENERLPVVKLRR